jgi:hypothetical protein
MLVSFLQLPSNDPAQAILVYAAYMPRALVSNGGISGADVLPKAVQPCSMA